MFTGSVNAPLRGERSHAGTAPDIKSRLPRGILFGSGAPKTHEHTSYYLCKHVTLLSNEPFTGSTVKQLALTQAK